jgi:DNA-binding transcriptional LysR family regulator
MDLQLRHVRTFLSVAEHAHFSRAAEQLGIPQPTASRHVRELEQQLGVTLFTRTSRSTTLTDAGSALLEPARALLASAERLQLAAEATTRQRRDEVSVGFMSTTVGPFLAPLVQALARTHPEVSLNVAQVQIRAMLTALRRGTLDIAITRRLRTASEMVEQVLAEEPMCVALPAGGPLARRRLLRLADLDGAPLVVMRRSVWAPGHDALLARLRTVGIEPRIAQQATSLQSALALVQAGSGVYLLPASASVPQPGVAYRPLDGATTTIVLVRRPTPPTPAQQAVIDAAMETAATLTPAGSSPGPSGR